MVPDVADLLLRGSIWLSVVAWTAAECVRLATRQTAGRERTARSLWTAGVVLALLHVALAFHIRHGWSQASALAETLRETEELLGFGFGDGLYANYAFLVVWAADTLWWWGGPASFSTRPPALDTAIRLFLLFIFVNGTIVFGHGPVRILGIAAVVTQGVAWYRGRGVRHE